MQILKPCSSVAHSNRPGGNRWPTDCGLYTMASCKSREQIRKRPSIVNKQIISVQHFPRSGIHSYVEPHTKQLSRHIPDEQLSHCQTLVYDRWYFSAKHSPTSLRVWFGILMRVKSVAVDRNFWPHLYKQAVIRIFYWLATTTWRNNRHLIRIRPSSATHCPV